MTIDDRGQNGPEEQKRPGDEPAAEEPRGEEPAAEEAGGEEPGAEEPRPEDPRGPQAPPPPGPQAPPASGWAPPASEAPTERLGPEPRRLLRSRSNRVIGGVCGGLGRYFSVDPILFRIALIVLVFVGGVGVLLYLAALLLIPSEGSDAAAKPPTEGRNRWVVIAVVVLALLFAWPFLLGGGIFLGAILIPLALLVGAGVLVWWLVSGEGPTGDAGDTARRAALGIGVLVICGFVAIGGAWAAAAGGGLVVTLLVIGAGIAILAGAFAKPVRWLVLPAVTLALSAGFVSAAGIDLDGGVGERRYRPASAADLRERYEIGIGQVEIDLRGTELPVGDTPLEIDVGVGEARLIVPENVCVATDAAVGMGAVQLFGRDSGGIDVDLVDEPAAPADTTRLVVDAAVGVGAVHVTHDPNGWGFRDADFGRGFDGDAGNAACSDSGAR
jgi:phage shock protein PspC (stress-responsive transcriptional regulator)